MDSPNEQKTDGALDEAKGKVKQAAGDLTDDASLHAEGQQDEAKGKLKQAAGDARKALDDLT
ncbi:MAG TPA: CsbD family protein [Bacteroidetes bacterium]|nr:CsbD family protein [Bacteroidota bacterium]HIL56350.1 CsbD family protein [Rhodothermales bacterium]